MATNDGGDDLSNWKEMTDKNTGKKFYYNTVTRKTQWTLPKATAVAEQVNVESGKQVNDHTSSTATAESLSDWKEMTDKNSGKKFFYNVKTRKTQWEKPAEFETSGRTKKTSNAGISSSETVDKDATKEAESESAAAEEKATTSHPTGDWISRTDPNTQRVYYFNKRTNKTQWEEPVEMQTAPTKDRGKATVKTSQKAESADKVASEWKEMTDKTSGRKFYYNVNTKKTQWNKPLEVPSKPAVIAAQKEAIVPQSTTPAKQDQASQWTVPEELKSNEELLTKVSENEIVGDKNATDKEGSIKNVKSDVSKVASYSYDKSLRLTSNGIWRTEFVNLTEDLFVLSQSGEWEDKNLFVLKLIDVTSVELQQHQKTEDGAYSSGFIIYFNPGTCEGLEDGTNEVRVKCRNDIESMEWVTMIDAQQDISKDKHAEKMKLVAVAKDAKAAKDSDVKLGREQKNVDSIVVLSPSHVALLDFLKSKKVISSLDTYPTDEQLIKIETEIEAIEDRNHRLLKQVLWMEWREKHGLPRNSPRMGSEDTKLENSSAVDAADVEKRRNALVRRRLMLSQYTKLIDMLRREPAVIAAVG
eukprot:g10973.t1